MRLLIVSLLLWVPQVGTCVISEANSCDLLSLSMISAQQDSVIFDLGASTGIGNSSEFPVYIISGDSIFALDFAFRFDMNAVAFDSLSVVSGSLQYLFYFNPVDSTFRFTSNSLMPMVSDTPLVLLRFSTLGSPMCINDLEITETYLNGNVCEHAIRNCVILDVPEEPMEESDLLIYPVPASEKLNVSLNSPAQVSLVDLRGKSVLQQFCSAQHQIMEMEIGFLNPGMYILQIHTATQKLYRKVLIDR
jgi:hypothetical protein